jgi:Cellulase (glycosyl hydrolase family 5)/Glycoside hydrolase family 5 C-terminal domain
MYDVRKIKTVSRQLFVCSLLFMVCLSVSPAYSSPILSTSKGEFVDQHNRTRYFRGINLAGSSKLPFSSWCKEGTTFCADVSFVGRPFPLNEADEHFRRLQNWGFNFLRLIVTWEALEHQGPKLYDREYINYIRDVIKKAGDYGFSVLIDSHQDVWSRFTGGDGAPLWTLEKVGFDISQFEATNAALVYRNPSNSIPTMAWPTNYSKLGSATMFTLFFAGNDFAPKTYIDGRRVQDYLQQHYIDAFTVLAQAVKSLPNVVGFDVMNEPHPGWIGQNRLSEYTAFPLRKLATPTPEQAIMLAAGFTVDVTNWKVGLLGLEEDGHILLNPEKKRAWQSGKKGVWFENGVWRDDNGEFKITNDEYFNNVNGRAVNFSQDYYAPFLRRFTRAIRNVIPNSLLFYEKPFLQAMPSIKEFNNVVNASHWYDQLTLIQKKYRGWITVDLATGKPIFGKKSIDDYFHQRVNKVIKYSSTLGGDAPTLVGEVGIPFDLSNGSSFTQRGDGQWDFSEQNYALDRSLRAMEGARVNYALWNYTPDNSNVYGDQWNGEDLSIYSPDQLNRSKKFNINNGGRALRAAIRPFASAVNGKVKKSTFDMQSGRYELAFVSSADHDSSVPTIIHLPDFYYQSGIVSELSDGRLVKTDNASLWHYFASPGQTEHRVSIRPKKAMAPITQGGVWTLARSIVIVVLLIFTVFIGLLVRRRYYS